MTHPCATGGSIPRAAEVPEADSVVIRGGGLRLDHRGEVGVLCRGEANALQGGHPGYSGLFTDCLLFGCLFLFPPVYSVQAMKKRSKLLKLLHVFVVMQLIHRPI